MTNYSKLFEKIKIDILKHIESNTQELSPSQRDVSMKFSMELFNQET